MQGILITNGFVQEASFAELKEALMHAASALGLELVSKTNDELLFDFSTGKPLFDINKYSFAILWDKDKPLGHMLEACGLRVFNSTASMSICDDKLLTHSALSSHGVLMPRTISVPRTYKYVGYGDFKFLDNAVQYLGLPMVVKECSGSFGKQVYLAENLSDIRRILSEHEGVPMILQEYIKSSFGRDIRLYVVGGKVIAAMLRCNDSDFRANIARGGTSLRHIPSADEIELAERAAKLLGLDYAGIDLLFGETSPLLCEVNSNAHFKGISACTDVDIAAHIMRHIKTELSDSTNS